ncbi:hypothetical protein [Terasakiella pusilla]|uniref:hypothetical protein n=1 Tax=Terasakiella pusilla TaxID=64973 RepID=UPI0012EB8B02|nr:hypothetical protein [Terasakiella pusilla]
MHNGYILFLKEMGAWGLHRQGGKAQALISYSIGATRLEDEERKLVLNFLMENAKDAP